jgi:hypothetical protein
MSSTIETTNNTIILKIQYLCEMMDCMRKAGTIVNPIYISELKSISDEYEMGSVRILSDYFLLVRSYKSNLKDELNANNMCSNKTLLVNEFQANRSQFIKQKEKFFRDYQIFIKKENFAGKMDRLYTIFKNIIKIKMNNENRPHHYFVELQALLVKYNSSTIVQTVNILPYTMCPDCDKEMKMLPISSEIVCTECGNSSILSGTVFEDEQFYYQEGQRTKHGSYEPTKHCRFWIERIQARESKTIPDTVINAVKKCIRHNNIKNIEELTCEEIRKYLRQTKYTTYNEHVPLIRKIITGITPPQLTDEEIQLIILIFSKAIKIYEEFKPSDKTNVMYHPYFIYKIIEHILNPLKMKRRKNAILSCIHLQSRETLIENDNVWEKMCQYLNVTYIPTDRNTDLN